MGTRERIIKWQQAVAAGARAGVSLGRPFRNATFANDQGRSILPFKFLTVALGFALTPELPAVETAAADDELLPAAIEFHLDGGRGVAGVADHGSAAIVDELQDIVSRRSIGGD